ncbi:hypothetical protein JXL83_04780 [candidate division WOR-3 bacterium]|nr:hypothetical protein [candidate division WOR-3 bacterium]
MKNSIILILTVLISGCSGDSNLSRISNEYFPLPDTGSFWTFSDTLNNTASISVSSVNYLHQGRYCSVWDFNGTYFYVWKDDGSVKTYRTFTRNFGGSSYVVENRWADLIKLPLIDGDRWSERYTNSINIAGVPYAIEITTDVSVTKKDVFTVPLGSFSDCYRVEITENVKETSSLMGNQSSTTRMSYVLAPSKGIVFFKDSTGEYYLTAIELN